MGRRRKHQRQRVDDARRLREEAERMARRNRWRAERHRRDLGFFYDRNEPVRYRFCTPRDFEQVIPAGKRGVRRVIRSTISDEQDTWNAARTGRLADLRAMIEAGADYTVVDEFGNTPLYYACLCGHADTARYLLSLYHMLEEAGEEHRPAETVRAELARCYLNAQFQRVRDVLRDRVEAGKSVIDAPETMPSDMAWALTEVTSGDGSLTDVYFQLSDGVIACHKPVLLAHWPKLRKHVRRLEAEAAAAAAAEEGGKAEEGYSDDDDDDHLAGQDGDRMLKIVVKPAVSRKLFTEVLRYVYCGRAVAIPEYHSKLLRLADKWGLHGLAEERMVRNLEELKRLEPRRVHEHNLAWLRTPAGLKLSDCVLVSEEGTEYPTHRVVLAARSGYFRAFLTGGWAESVAGSRRIVASASDRVLPALLTWMYTGELNMEIDEVVEMLATAGMLDIPRVNLMCQARLWREATVDVVVQLLGIAWTFDAFKLLELLKLKLYSNWGFYRDDAEFKQLPADLLVSLAQEAAAPAALRALLPAFERRVDKERRRAERKALRAAEAAPPPPPPPPSAAPTLRRQSSAERAAAVGDLWAVPADEFGKEEEEEDGKEEDMLPHAEEDPAEEVVDDDDDDVPPMPPAGPPMLARQSSADRAAAVGDLWA